MAGIIIPGSHVNAQQIGDACTTSGGLPGTTQPSRNGGTFCAANDQAAAAEQQENSEFVDLVGKVASGDIPGASSALLDFGGDCNFITGNWMDCIGNLLARIAWIIMTMMSWLLWLAGTLLNYVIKETVLTMKEGVDKMTGINIGWKVIRDVMNIGFIFLLVYEGILMIIGQNGKEKVKKYIFSIVLAALLINFSLFFTKILIDASNVVTVGLYNSMIDSGTPKAEVAGNTNTDAVEKRPVEGLSAPFMNKLKFQQLYGQDSFETISKKVGGGTNMLIFFLMGTILFFIMAFVFFAISIMFIIRYITLLILLMTSPVAYMGSAIPGMSTYSKQWWESLKGQLLFAPIYMLLTMIILKLIESENFIKTDNTNWSDIVVGANSNSALSLILNFTVIIGLAVASLVVAKTSATKGSSYIKDATGRLTAFAGGAVMGGTAALSRRTFGAGALKNTDVEKLEARIAAGGIDGQKARARLALAQGSFDIRRSRAGEAVSSQTGVDFGKGLPFKPKAGEGGRAATLLEKKKKNEGDLDKMMKSMVEKKEWSNLGDLIESRSDSEQKYIYKKLSDRDKVSIEKELDKRVPGNPLINSMREKIPFDDRINIFKNRKDWPGLASYLTSLTSEDQQNYIYEKLSARDRVELDKKGPLNPVLIARLRGELSTEEREKTEKEEKESVKKQKNEQVINDIDALSGLPGVAPSSPAVTLDALIGPKGGSGKNLPAKETRNLDKVSRMNPEVIMRLSKQHLRDLRANGNLEQDEIDQIANIITGPTPYGSQADHLKFINQKDQVDFWIP